MRRSICVCEPNVVYAGAISNWKFSFTPSTNLPKGTRLRFDLLSKGREIDWQLPATDPKEVDNLIWVDVGEKKPLYAKEVELPDRYTPLYEFTLGKEVKAGDTLFLYLGSPKASSSGEKGNRAQILVQRRRPFHLYVDPKGKGDFRDPEIFTVDVRGNALSRIRIAAPSIVSKGKRFDVVVRFEDLYGNLTSNAPEGTLIELSYEHLRENLNWKLFVPETGFINLPNLYFNEPGTYKIQLRNMLTEETYYSTPIKCFVDYDKSLYWGSLHAESERFDATENIELLLRHFRDEQAFQFFGSSPFEAPEETSNEEWKLISQQMGEFNEYHRFVTLLGFQWFEATPEEGLRQMIYSKENKPLMRKKDAKYSSLKKIYKGHSPKELLSIPCFTMAKGFETTFQEFAPEHERVVEIYNAWGSSECLEEEGNPRPIKSEGSKGVRESAKGALRAALNRNCRFGFVAGGLDDRGVYEHLFDSEQIQYSPGLTGILAIEQSREALFLALYNRACYATTGARIVLGFSIAGSAMGAELSTKLKPGLAFNRHITGFVAGTAEIDQVEIVRNGQLFKVLKPEADSSYHAFELDDSEKLAECALKSPDERPHFIYYYMRVLQKDGEIAWSSPIWVDYPDHSSSSAPAKRQKRKS